MSVTLTALPLAVGGPLYAREMHLGRRPGRVMLVAPLLCLLAAGAGCGKSVVVGTVGHAGSQSVGTNMTTVIASASSVPPPAHTTQRAAVPAATPTAPSSGAPPRMAPGSGAPLPTRPAIVQSPIPFGAKRKAEMVNYALRHYGLDTY